METHPSVVVNCHPQTERTQESSFFRTAAKWTFLGAAGYGLYSLGTQVAANVAGQKFEEFAEKFTNMDLFDREQFVQNWRNAASFENFNPSSFANSTSLQAYTQQVVDFGGNLKGAFSDLVLRNIPTSNLGIRAVVDEAKEIGYNSVLALSAAVSFLFTYKSFA